MIGESHSTGKGSCNKHCSTERSFFGPGKKVPENYQDMIKDTVGWHELGGEPYHEEVNVRAEVVTSTMFW